MAGDYCWGGDNGIGAKGFSRKTGWKAKALKRFSRQTILKASSQSPGLDYVGVVIYLWCQTHKVYLKLESAAC